MKSQLNLIKKVKTVKKIFIGDIVTFIYTMLAQNQGYICMLQSCIFGLPTISIVYYDNKNTLIDKITQHPVIQSRQLLKLVFEYVTHCIVFTYI